MLHLLSRTTPRISRGVIAAVVAVLLVPAFTVAEQGYRYGGTIPLDESLQEELDRRVGSIRLGLNGTRLTDSGFDPDAIVRAMLFMSDAVEADHLASAVVYVDSFAGDNMAVGIGDAQKVPMRVPADWSTCYELGELTAALVTIPLALRAIQNGDLSLRDTVGKWVPELEERPLGELTVEQLLRHMSGLSADISIPVTVRNRQQLMRHLGTIEPDQPAGRQVVQSSMNMMLMGLVLEKLLGAPPHEFAESHYFSVLGMSNTVSPIPDQLRVTCAAGPITNWHGRMVWGEAEDPAAYILGSSAGHGGLLSNPDDMGIFARALLFANEIGIPDLLEKEAMEFSLRPSRASIGGETQGLGWQLNGFGRGSFGYTASNGSAVWVDPVHRVFVVVLANRNHPQQRGTELIDTVLPMFLQMTREAVRGHGDEA